MLIWVFTWVREVYLLIIYVALLKETYFRVTNEGRKIMGTLTKRLGHYGPKEKVAQN